MSPCGGHLLAPLNVTVMVRRFANTTPVTGEAQPVRRSARAVAGVSAVRLHHSPALGSRGVKLWKHACDLSAVFT